MARAVPRTYLDDDLIRDFCAILRKGNFRMTACARLGVSYSTMQSWMRKGRAEIETYDPANGEPSIYAHFVLCVLACETEMETSLVQDVIGDPDWRAKTWFLEHRWNKKYTKNPNVVIDDDEIELVRVDPLNLLVEKLRELRALGDGSSSDS